MKHKFAFRDECTNCNVKKDDAAMAKISAYMAYLKAKGKPANFRPGDWECPSCQMHCYANKTACHACEARTARPTPDAEVVALFGEEYFTSLANAAEASAAAAPADAQQGSGEADKGSLDTDMDQYFADSKKDIE